MQENFYAEESPSGISTTPLGVESNLPHACDCVVYSQVNRLQADMTWRMSFQCLIPALPTSSSPYIHMYHSPPQLLSLAPIIVDWEDLIPFHRRYGVNVSFTWEVPTNHISRSLCPPYYSFHKLCRSLSFSTTTSWIEKNSQHVHHGALSRPSNQRSGRVESERLDQAEVKADVNISNYIFFPLAI